MHVIDYYYFPILDPGFSLHYNSTFQSYERIHIIPTTFQFRQICKNEKKKRYDNIIPSQICYY